jgi:hypothetical protein
MEVSVAPAEFRRDCVSALANGGMRSNVDLAFVHESGERESSPLSASSKQPRTRLQSGFRSLESM